MTNFYETLGIVHTATFEDVEKAYQVQAKYFDPDLNPDAPDVDQRRIFFDDIKLAYNTLINEGSRTEYDEYISQSRFSANYAGEKIDDETARKRKEEKGKKRFEEDFSYANDEFFSAW